MGDAVKNFSSSAADVTGSALDKIGGAVKEGVNYATGGALGEKVGLGKYKPEGIVFDESVFADRSAQDRQIEELQRQREAIQARQAPTVEAAQLGAASTMTPAQLAEAERARAAQLSNEQQQFRNRQMTLADQLAMQAQGQGPSLAAGQLQDARNQNIETAMALAASQRGLTAGQGLRSIADQTAQANQVAARDAARARIAEQLAARQQLSGVLQGARGMDVDVASRNAALEQQTALANQQAANQFALQQGTMDQQAAAANQAAQNAFASQQAGLTQQANLANQTASMNMNQLNDRFLGGLNQQIAGLDMTTQQNLMDLQRLRANVMLGQQNIESGAYKDYSDRIGGFYSGLGEALMSGPASSMSSIAPMGASSAAGGSGVAGAAATAAPAAAASDENLKTNIRSGEKELDGFLSALGSHSYDYKDKKWGDKTYTSPMAQELEKSQLGKSMVIDTPDGKMVDYARGAGTYLAAAAMLNKRLKKIEKSLSRKKA